MLGLSPLLPIKQLLRRSASKPLGGNAVFRDNLTLLRPPELLIRPAATIHQDEIDQYKTNSGVKNAILEELRKGIALSRGQIQHTRRTFYNSNSLPGCAGRRSTIKPP